MIFARLFVGAILSLSALSTLFMIAFGIVGFSAPPKALTTVHYARR